MKPINDNNNNNNKKKKIEENKVLSKNMNNRAKTPNDKNKKFDETNCDNDKRKLKKDGKQENKKSKEMITDEKKLDEKKYVKSSLQPKYSNNTSKKLEADNSSSVKPSDDISIINTLKNGNQSLTDDEKKSSEEQKSTDIQKDDDEDKSSEKFSTTTLKFLHYCSCSDWDNVIDMLKDPRNTINFKVFDKKSKWTPIMYAVKDSRIDIIEKLLAAGCDVNAIAKDCTTALHIAAFQAKEDVLRLLMMHKANPLIPGGVSNAKHVIHRCIAKSSSHKAEYPKKEYPIHILTRKWKGSVYGSLLMFIKTNPKESRLVQDADGNIALMNAVEVGNYGVCRELLSSYASAQLTSKRTKNGDTVVHIATRKRDMEMMRLLMDYNVDINLTNRKKETPLHIVVNDGDENWVRFLHLHEADIDVEDINERTPLVVATENGHWKIVDYLLEKSKGIINTRNKEGNTLLHLAAKGGSVETIGNLIKKGVPVKMPNKDGSRAIHIASYSGQVELVKNILQRGEDVHVQNNDGYTPLHCGVAGGKVSIVETLIANRADVNIVSELTGDTPLHLAAKNNGKECAHILIKSGSNLNATNHLNETALMLAAAYGNVDIFTLLLKHGANYEMRNTNEENLIHIAVKNCHLKIIEKLIDQIENSQSSNHTKSFINQPNNKGETCLHYAGLFKSKEEKKIDEIQKIIEILLKNGGDISIETIEAQETAVHYCCKIGNLTVMKQIVKSLPMIDVQSAFNKPSKIGWTPILFASHYGYPDLIPLLLEQNAKVDVFDEKGLAGLHLAADSGHLDVIEILLQNKAFVNVRNKTGMTPLHLAAKHGYNEIINHLLTKYDAQIDAMTMSKQTPLHFGAEYGQLEACKTLLNFKADVKAVDNQNQTPLHLAAESNHPEVFKLFLENYPGLMTVSNKNGYTCGHIAATQGSVSVLKELLKFDKERIISVRLLKKDSTPLHCAAENGHCEVVKLLLSAGAKPQDEDSEGMTPLHLAAKHGHIDIFRILKDCIDPKTVSRRNGLTPLHVAASYGQTDFVGELLINVPGNIVSEKSLKNIHGEYGITPLHLAAQNGHESVVRLLLNSTGVQVNAPTKLQGTIPMHLAAQGGHMIVAGLLISRSPESLFKTNKEGKTCLHFASSHGQFDMISLLLGQGAEINACDNNGWTPLHYASKHGFLDVVKLLVESGGDADVLNKDNKSALHLATSSGHTSIITYLLTIEHDSIALLEDKKYILDLMYCSKNNENQPLREFILSSDAPIDIAVKLARNYEQLSIKEKDKSRDLLAAAAFCDEIAIELLNIIATTYSSGELLRAVDHKNTEMLDVLIELERKKVVSQHAVQKYLTKIWIGDLTWSSTKFLLFFIATFICPILWIIVSIPFGHSLHRIPIIKFMSYLTGHVYFIIVLVYSIVFPPIPIPRYHCCVPLWNEWILMAWLLGFAVSEIINPRDRSGLGGIKICIICIGFIAIIVHFGTFIINLFLDDYQVISNEYWYIRRADILYARNQLYALAMLLAFVEFLNFLTVHPLFGPWGVVIVELVHDLLKFLSLLVLFLAGFTLSITAIYQPVYQSHSINHSIPPYGQWFIHPVKTSELMFFALFGIIVSEDMPAPHLNPSFSKIIMKSVFGLYMLMMTIVLINLLIAMMSNTFQRIEEQSDMEWKFGRAKLIQNMNRTLSTPSPINLIIGIPYLLGEKIRETFWTPPKTLKSVGGIYSDISRKQSADDKSLSRRDSKISHLSVITRAFDNIRGKHIANAINWVAVKKKYYEGLGVSNANVQDDYDDS